MKLLRTAYSKLRDYIFVIHDSLFQSSANHILDDLTEYILKFDEYLKVRNIRTPSGFTDDIGKSVLFLMYANRHKQKFQRHMEIILLICGCNLREKTLEDYLGNKVLYYGRGLETGRPHDCLAYFAVICELIMGLKSPKQSYLRKRILNVAKRCMSKHAEGFENYRHLACYAEKFIEVLESMI